MKTIELPDLLVQQFVWNIVDSNCYVIQEEYSALIIDPIDLNEFFEYLTTSKIKDCTVILTHAHFDHICGLNKLRNTNLDCKVVCSKQCSINIQDSRKNLSSIANAYIAFHEKWEEIRDDVRSFTCQAADTVFENEINLKWCSHTLILQEYYGHSNDSICCILDDRCLFSGDTLLSIPTVTRFPGGSKKQFQEHDLPMLETIANKITAVLPGHGEPGSMAEMLKMSKQ